jgi:hypothetical protein
MPTGDWSSSAIDCVDETPSQILRRILGRHLRSLGGTVSGRTALQQTLLNEGLEDLIPLPEIATTVQNRQLAPSEFLIQEVSFALIKLLDEKLIQVWAGHWSTEPQVLDDAAARDLLGDTEQYEFNSPSDLVRRIYYVNVENVRAPRG